MKNPRWTPSWKRRRRSQNPCAIRDGGCHEQSVDIVKIREEFAVEALMEQQRRRSQVPCAIRDGGVHEIAIEVVKICVQSAKDASMVQAPENRVPCAIRDGGTNDKLC